MSDGWGGGLPGYSWREAEARQQEAKKAALEKWHDAHDAAIARGCDEVAAVQAADAPSSRPHPPSSQEQSRPEVETVREVKLKHRVTEHHARVLVSQGEEVRASTSDSFEPMYLHYEVVHLSAHDLQRAAYLKTRGELHDLAYLRVVK